VESFNDVEVAFPEPNAKESKVWASKMTRKKKIHHKRKS
jgi:hypothetical protein